MRFQFLKWIGGPGSIGFFVAAMLLGFILSLWSRRLRRPIRNSLILLTALYVILSLPVVAHGLAARLGGNQTLPSSSYRPVDHIFLLEGDNYEQRGALAARLAAIKPPQAVWVLGGGLVKDAAVAHGLSDDLWRWAGLPDPSTHGQIVHVQRIIEREHIQSSVVIVSRVQAPRTIGLVTRMGLQIPVAASALDREPPTTGVRLWLPSLAALALSRDAIYEHAALAYYKWKGWI